MITVERRTDRQLFALKRMAKKEVVKSSNNIASVWAERDIISSVQSPFVVCTCRSDVLITIQHEAQFAL